MAIASRYANGLANGTPLLGAFCCLDGFSVSHIFAKAGFDFLVLDRQHAAYDWHELEQMCFRIKSEGTAVFIRTGSAAQQEIDLALDLPIEGIVIPNSASLEEAKQALSFTKYPPLGIRSVGNERHEAIRDVGKLGDPLVGLLIEHPGAVEAIDEILSLEVDFAWVGTHDLAALMGMEPWDPETGEMPSELAKALDRVKRSAEAHGVPFWQPPGKGVPIGIADVDARLVRQAAEQAVAKWKS